MRLPHVITVRFCFRAQNKESRPAMLPDGSETRCGRWWTGNFFVRPASGAGRRPAGLGRYNCHFLAVPVANQSVELLLYFAVSRKNVQFNNPCLLRI